MKVIGLDDKFYTIQLSSYEASLSDSRNHSDLHVKAKALLHNIYPLDRIFEEVYLPGAPDVLYLDLFLARRNLAIEVQGEQHYKFVSHFHKNKLSFFQGQRRDRLKHEWCNLNGLTLIELAFNETVEEWSNKILSR